jgi:cytochrome c peroxidase
MRRTLWIAAALVAVLAMGMRLTAADPQSRAKELFKPIPVAAHAIADNPSSPDKVALGAMLYFEPRLSKSSLISCSTCHSLGTGGADNLRTSIGHGWQRGPRNAPTVLNAVFNTAQFWDGRAADLKAQAKGPVQAGVEMNNTPDRALETLRSMPEYVERFRKAFPGEANPVTFDNMAAAIEVFEATLTTPNGPFDRYLGGDGTALTDQQKAGLTAFMDKGCVMCHRGVNLGGDGYFPFGVVKKPGADILPVGDKGRFAVTKTATDEYVFRASPLRNVSLTAPYFHSGEVWDLEEAVAIMGSAQLGATLTHQEASDITAFLKSLTGEAPKVVYPVLPPSGPATPKPESE